MIRRNKPLVRSTTRIPRRRSKPRRGPLRCQPYKNWLKAEGKCRACQIEVEHMPLQAFAVVTHRRYRAGFEAGYCDPAHTENGGTSMKGPDSSCAPLCRGFDTPNHHREYDAGRARFVARYGYDPKDEAAAHWAAWLILEGKL